MRKRTEPGLAGFVLFLLMELPFKDVYILGLRTFVVETLDSRLG